MKTRRTDHRPRLFRAITAWVTRGDMTNHTRHRNVQGGASRAAVLGAGDGLITNVSLILGVAGASTSASTVRLAMPGGLDPTGYVKGWAAQRALGALASTAISGAIINAAGDIASFGAMAHSQAFRVGIVDPFAPSQLACVVELTGSIATSGTAERGNHLIDPHSGRPTARVASASVSGPDLGLADALATAVAVAGEEGLRLVEALDDYEALIIGFDGTIRRTEHFPLASPVHLQK